MFVRQMSYLLALAREKHFTRAAESCCVTQSTLSSGLKALERELNMPLVLRGSRFIGLTPEGERVAAWAVHIVSDYENLKQDVAGLRSGLKGTLRLGVVPAAMPAVAKLTAPFCAQNPGLAVNVISLTSAEIQVGIDKFDLDAGITYLENEPLTKVRKIPLYEERYLLVTHIDSPLAQMPSVSWRDAAAENLCLLNESMQNRRILNNLARSFGIELIPSITSNSYLAICSHVCTGGWASIIPHTFSYIFRGCRELTFVELVGPKHSQSIGIVVSERDPLSPIAHALLRCAGRMVANNPLVPSLA
ncbi:LysR family transcriptional regulator [Hyphomicrobium sp.]|uniref:LysR family transcriptional regulator n=1 Tax=Hyphomicrobium sp. TaxID=82 RepID=UPI000FAC76D7|nr:LysR family transcriptional regulator [Hyphomicrobium sp.]RUP00359.1 MAG: LysR family transcriptional regulator [Hyphomicrobium sp.]